MLYHLSYRKAQMVFERIDCVRLQQQVISLYIFEYSLIIMVNARWLTRQRSTAAPYTQSTQFA